MYKFWVILSDSTVDSARFKSPHGLQDILIIVRSDIVKDKIELNGPKFNCWVVKTRLFKMFSGYPNNLFNRQTQQKFLKFWKIDQHLYYKSKPF